VGPCPENSQRTSRPTITPGTASMHAVLRRRSARRALRLRILRRSGRCRVSSNLATLESSGKPVPARVTVVPLYDSFEEAPQASGPRLRLLLNSRRFFRSDYGFVSSLRVRLLANSSARRRSSALGLPLFMPPKCLKKLFVLKPLQLNSSTIS